MERYARGEIDLWDLASVYEWEFPSIEEPFPTKLFGKPYDMRTSYYNDGLNFLSNFKGYDDCKILDVEEKFCIQVDDWLLNGFIDITLEDKAGRLILQDYKSKKSFKSKAEQAEYARQLYLYSLHVKEKYGRYPDVLRFKMFRKDLDVDISFDEGALNEAVEWAKDTVAAIRECWDYEATCDDFFGNNLCNFREICPMKPAPSYATYGANR